MSMSHTVTKEMVTVVPGVVQHEVLVYEFTDGETWTQVTEWENKPRAGWRSGRCMVFVKVDGVERKSTMTRFLKKLGGSTKNEVYG